MHLPDRGPDVVPDLSEARTRDLSEAHVVVDLPEVRPLPRALRLPEGAPERSLRLHTLELALEPNPAAEGRPESPAAALPSSAVLGLFLPAELDAELTVYPPGRSARCRLRPLPAGAAQVSREELERLAAWSFGALALFSVPVAPLARRICPHARSLVLGGDSGAYAPGPTAGDQAEGPGDDEPYCVAAPLMADGGVDWPLVELGLRVFGGALPALGPLDDPWTDGPTGAGIALQDLVVLAHGRGSRGRTTQSRRARGFTRLCVSRLHDRQLFASEVVHRGFPTAGADVVPLPGEPSDVFALDGQPEILVLPLPAPTVHAVLALPAVLWQVEAGPRRRKGTDFSGWGSRDTPQ